MIQRLCPFPEFVSHSVSWIIVEVVSALKRASIRIKRWRAGKRSKRIL
jgi:hypothetical protein